MRGSTKAFILWDNEASMLAFFNFVPTFELGSEERALIIFWNSPKSIWPSPSAAMPRHPVRPPVRPSRPAQPS